MAELRGDRRPLIREILGAAGESGDTAFVADLLGCGPDGPARATAPWFGWRAAMAQLLRAFGPRRPQMS